jgi:glutathione-regulated potassium-efflux system ancillary protein KefG
MKKPHKILILFAHPLYEKSQVNKILVDNIPHSPNITFHDLYEEYPEFDVDIKKEQELLLNHDIIIWHHPMYWYNCPPLLKQWMDLVLEFGWAYGKEGNNLKNKTLFQVITTGGSQENYCSTGRDRFTIPELLEPVNQTAKVCKMHYLPPFVVHGTHKITPEETLIKAKLYNQLLTYLEEKGIQSDNFDEHIYLNHWIQSKL